MVKYYIWPEWYQNHDTTNMNYYSRNPWFHVCSEGEYTIFRDPEDCIFFMNRLAALDLQHEDLAILAFAVPNTHFHKVVSCALETVNKCVSEIKSSVKRHFFNKYHFSLDDDYFKIGIFPLENTSYRINAVSYCLWNPPHHKICESPFSYPYSSVGCYFKDTLKQFDPSTFKTAGKPGIPFRNIKNKSAVCRATVGRTLAIPDDWTIVEGNLIHPDNFIFNRPVEMLFRDSFKSFFYRVSGGLEETGSMIHEAGCYVSRSKLDSEFIPIVTDFDVCRKISEFTSERNLENFKSISPSDYRIILRELAGMNASKEQILRCMWITEEEYSRLRR